MIGFECQLCGVAHLLIVSPIELIVVPAEARRRGGHPLHHVGHSRMGSAPHIRVSAQCRAKGVANCPEDARMRVIETLPKFILGEAIGTRYGLAANDYRPLCEVRPFSKKWN